MPTQDEHNGLYNTFGGAYVPEVLISPITELASAFNIAKTDKQFQQTLSTLLKDYTGRPTPLTEAKNLAAKINGPRIFLKREDLLHTGAHKINNALGQCLLAKQMGKTRIIAETGAGQHGVATATACAFLNLKCIIYMGEEDIKRQAPNVAKIQLLGAEIVSVAAGSKTLKEAINAALRDYAENFESSHYCIGSVLGPHPFPEMVAHFQSVIGAEAKQQIQQQCGQLPTAVIACVGGGSNAIGIFSAFINEPNVELIGVEGGGHGENIGEHAARFLKPDIGILHGTKTYVLQDENGQVAPTHSISAGLDYPAVGPQHAALYQNKRANYTRAQDDLALTAFKLLSETEGIIPALESSHAIAYLLSNEAKKYSADDIVLINLSGRGDKDLPSLQQQGLV